MSIGDDRRDCGRGLSRGRHHRRWLRYCIYSVCIRFLEGIVRIFVKRYILSIVRSSNREMEGNNEKDRNDHLVF